MKFEIDFSPLPDYVLIKTEGKVSVEDIENLFKTLVSSPKWKPGTAQLYDHRKSILKDYPSEDMRTMVNIVKRNSKQLGSGPCALVVKGQLGFGLARMYQMLGGNGIHVKIGIFHTVEEAAEWLKKR